MSCVLEALKHMHGQGLVHTDLKPENILLRGTARFREHWNKRVSQMPSVPDPDTETPPEVKY